MATEPAYIIHRNIRRYRALLENKDTPAVTRETVTRLLAEAWSNLGGAEQAEADARPDD